MGFVPTIFNSSRCDAVGEIDADLGGLGVSLNPIPGVGDLGRIGDITGDLDLDSEDDRDLENKIKRRRKNIQIRQQD